ncbi:MAG: hypothetical protein ACRDHE_15310 [Ktedonobacterales bacterium]
MPDAQGALTPEQRAVARRYGRQIGIAAAALSLLAALVSVSAAATNRQDILTVQRALIDLANQGDAQVIPPLATLAPMFFATYLANALTFLLTLGLCIYAGNVTASRHRNADAGSVAGAWVVLIGGGAWLLVTTLLALFTQLDGTFAWFFATLGAVFLSSSSSAAQASVAQPGPLFVLLHLVIVLVQNGLGFGFAVGVGSLMGRRGVTTRRREPRNG